MKVARGNKSLVGLVIGALGVVYGDIGTSPLYALRECFHGPYRIAASPANVLGIVSLIFWSLIVIVTIKYILFVMRADNKGEGGILALMALAFPDRGGGSKGRGRTIMVTLGVFGAALLYGDGMITPAISVLSAIEGLKIAVPQLGGYIIEITIVILILLFSCQRHGTGKVGRVFGPITLLWFVVITLLGLRGILLAPGIVASLNPWFGLQFFLQNGLHGFVVLGAVFLCVTGGEALYADMGHFGRNPIRVAWFAVVLPALVVNYLGQGALLLHNPQARENPFYLLAPEWAMVPLVILATAATVIASQALISGAYSLTMQAIQLGFSPRMEISYTSSYAKGQIYIRHINRLLMLACIGLVLGFRNSHNLAAAYGIAVTLTMIITTVLFFFASRRLWHWSLVKALSLCSLFLGVELAFFGANMLKIAHGGWFPLLMGLAIFTLMSTWKTGRRILGERLSAAALPYRLFLDDILSHPPLRVSGSSIFLSGNPDGTPLALLHNLKHNKVLHERVTVLTILTEDVPHVEEADRLQIIHLRDQFWRVIARYGFMEDANVPDILKACEARGLVFKAEDTTFFLSRIAIIPTTRPGMAIWREKLFAFMARNAQRATDFFRIPPNRVVELGMQVEI